MYQSVLTDRVEIFGKNVVKFAKKIPRNTITLPIISQFIRSGTSVGANYFEADNAESKNDFIHKSGIAKKEARETVYWLKMIIEAEPSLEFEAKILCQESKEINLILNSIINKVRLNQK